MTRKERVEAHLKKMFKKTHGSAREDMDTETADALTAAYFEGFWAGMRWAVTQVLMLFRLPPWPLGFDDKYVDLEGDDHEPKDAE